MGASEVSTLEMGSASEVSSLVDDFVVVGFVVGFVAFGLVGFVNGGCLRRGSGCLRS